jgi:hypothetical protein
LAAGLQQQKLIKKNLVTSLFSLCSNGFIQVVLDGLLRLPSQNFNRHGQHDYGGEILPIFEKKVARG